MYLGSLKSDFNENLRLVHVWTVQTVYTFYVHTYLKGTRLTILQNKNKQTLPKSNIPTNKQITQTFFLMNVNKETK